MCLLRDQTIFNAVTENEHDGLKKWNNEKTTVFNMNPGSRKHVNGIIEILEELKFCFAGRKFGKSLRF
jgi:hypothetical protein